MLISVTSMVIISQQHFLYNPAIFIPINAKNIPAPARQPPQINILISQYTIPATTGLDIPLLICAMFFVADIIHPAMVCTKVAIVSKNTTQDVQELLGHSDVSTTMNVYAHSTRKAKRESAKLLDKVAGND